MRDEVRQDWGRAEQFSDVIEAVICENAGAIINVRRATPTEDLRRATDLVVETEHGGEVAARVRFNCDYRDLTLRCARWRDDEWVYGWEAQKIAEGFARWYCYVWVYGGELADWIFVDLDAVRGSGLIQPPLNGNPGWLVAGRDKPNPDHLTRFTWIEIPELKAAGALVAQMPDDEEQLGLPLF